MEHGVRTMRLPRMAMTKTADPQRSQISMLWSNVHQYELERKRIAKRT